MDTLYLALDILTAVNEANQGFAFKVQPCVLCAYEVDCDDIADLPTQAAAATHDVRWADLACPWFSFVVARKQPPSWALAKALIAAGHAGALVPSFAPSATAADHNLVLWRWGEHRPHKVRVFDPGGRLPKDQLSWG